MYNPDKHHRQSVRIKNYVYNKGFYFVTICCENRCCIFGEIQNDIMILNDCGKIVQNELSKTEKNRKNVKLHEFVIMPNHIHLIIEIKNPINIANIVVGARRALPKESNVALPRNSCALPNRFQNQGKSTLSSVVGSLKSAISKEIHRINYTGQIWQRNYYESVIRNENQYSKIAEYITNNPKLWGKNYLSTISPASQACLL